MMCMCFIFENLINFYLLEHGNPSQHVAAQCLATLGSVDVVYGTSRFKNSSMVIVDSVDVVMDDLYISSNVNPIEISQDITAVDGIRSFFIDTVLDEGVDLIFPEFCRIDCHQIVAGNMSLIRQLVVDCNSSYHDGQPISIRNNTEFESFEFWSAHRIIINNDTVSSVYPGALLPINYSIVDRDGRSIDDFAFNISISLSNEDLNSYSNLLIQENGECPLCDIGVVIQGISIDDFNTTYTITVDVDDNVLISNDIEFTVDLCPSGFGVFGWGQCSECNEGRYSIDKTADECMECDGDLLEDMVEVMYHLHFTIFQANVFKFYLISSKLLSASLLSVIMSPSVWAVIRFESHIITG